jgi:hypothetical protein
MVKIGGFFFHKGYSDYLKYTLNSCIKNFDNDFFLIGDESNKQLESLKCVHYNMDDYNTDIEDFKKLFYEKPITVNSLEYELNCYLRWIYLRNVMIKENIDICVYFDSDIFMVNKFSELNIDLLNMPQNHYYITGNGHVVIPHITIIPINVLIKFIEFMFFAFNKPHSHMLNWAEKINSEVSLKKHLSDMYFFGDFGANHSDSIYKPFNVIDGIDDFKRIELMNYGFSKNLFIDSNINYLIDDKNIIFFKKDNNIYINYHDKILKILLFHFQGNSKQYIKKFDNKINILSSFNNTFYDFLK